MKRYSLDLPNEVYSALKGIAEERNMTLADVMRDAIKWELLVDSIKDNEGRILVERKKGDDPVEVLL